MKKLIPLLLLSFTFSGCVTLSPITDEKRDVSEVVDSSKSVTIPEGMVFFDSRPAVQGIRFPEGVYTLEGEDEEYFYFRSPNPIEFRTFDRGIPASEEKKIGGLMLGKSLLKMVPAGGYIDDEAGQKKLVWKLGKEFLSLEGKYWERNYK